MAGTDSTGEVWEFEPCASMLTISYVAATKSQSLVHPALLALPGIYPGILGILGTPVLIDLPLAILPFQGVKQKRIYGTY